MGQPATAAIIVACIFLAIGGTFAGYKVYKKVWYYRQKTAYEETLPPIREPFTAYTVTSPGGSPAPLPGGTHSQTATLTSPYSTWKGSHDALAALTNGASGSSFQGSPNEALGLTTGEGNNTFFDRTRNSSQAGSIGQSNYDSAPHSPVIPSGHLSAGTRSFDAGSEFGAGSIHGLHTRSINGSTSSTMALKRAVTPSVYKGSSTTHIGLPSTSSSRRESYLPHNPANRESMTIIPPQPLGFGSATSMAMGTDQRTLAFSKVSGVGSNDDFSAHFAWMGSKVDGGGPEAEGELAMAPGSDGNGKMSLAAAERERYLRQGPSAGLSRTSSPGAMSAGSNPAYPAPARVDSRNSSRGSTSRRPSAQDAGLGLGPAGVLPASSPQASASGSRLPPYPPSAAASTFKGLHQFGVHHQSTGSASMGPLDGQASGSQAVIDESPIMAPFRVNGVASNAISNQQGVAGNGTGSTAGSDPLSASASQTGSSAGTATGTDDPSSTGPTTAYTSSSGPPSRSSGSFKGGADGKTAAQDGATGPEDPTPAAGDAKQEDSTMNVTSIVSSAAAYGAGLISGAGQKFKSVTAAT